MLLTEMKQVQKHNNKLHFTTPGPFFIDAVCSSNIMT